MRGTLDEIFAEEFMNNREEDEFLRTDERNEAIMSLKKTIQFLNETRDEVYNWKWVIISLHNCLQSFMILALKGSNSLSVMKPKDADRWLEAYYNDKEYPKVMMDNFHKLFQKIKGDSMLQFTYSKKFVSNERIDKSVYRLNELRNNFIHFMPMGWSIELRGLPRLVNDIIEIINFLLHDSGNIYFYEEGLQEYVGKLLDELASQINR